MVLCFRAALCVLWFEDILGRFRTPPALPAGGSGGAVTGNDKNTTNALRALCAEGVGFCGETVVKAQGSPVTAGCRMLPK